MSFETQRYSQGFHWQDAALQGETGVALNPYYLRQRPEFQQVALAPSHLVNLNALGNASARLVTTTWNRYGGLLFSLSDALGFDPGVAAAVLAIESGGRGFAADGRMIIRLEIHQFLRQWGPEHREQFQVHFSFDPAKPWKNQQWRPAPHQVWRNVHGSQSYEWAKNFEIVAEIYNGSGNVAQYSSLLHNASEAFQQLNAL